MRDSRSSAIAVSVLVAALLLGGCSFRIVDPAADSGTSDGTPTPASENLASDDPASDDPAQRTDETAPTESADPEGSANGLGPEHAANRQELLDAASTTMPCPPDALQQDGTIIRVEGACDEIVIESDAGAVIVDDVSTLVLTGSGTVVYAESIGEIRVSGSANEIYWVGETPKVTDSGSANTLRRG